MRSELLKQIDRIVVKVGTGVLTDAQKRLDVNQMRALVAQLARLQKAGKQVVLVTSGAVGAGMGVLGFDKRPTEVSEQQACAAVGQSRLMAMYESLFAPFGIHVAQVLLTHADLEHKERNLNARNTLVTLLNRNVVPIINENDAVSFTELKFGDNDKLSALVAALLPADLLVILTTVDGVIENFGKSNARLMSTVEKVEAAEGEASGTTSTTAVGGMLSKMQAAKIATRSGIPLIIASGLNGDSLDRILKHEEVGTLFLPQARKLKSRKRWIAFFHKPKGTLVVDDGAKKALRESGKSLLQPGIARCEGEFDAGEVVKLCDLNGTEFARGIAAYDSDFIRAGDAKRVEIVHRDNLVIL